MKKQIDSKRDERVRSHMLRCFSPLTNRFAGHGSCSKLGHCRLVILDNSCLPEEQHWCKLTKLNTMLHYSCSQDTSFSELLEAVLLFSSYQPMRPMRFKWCSSTSSWTLNACIKINKPTAQHQMHPLKNQDNIKKIKQSHSAEPPGWCSCSKHYALLAVAFLRAAAAVAEYCQRDHQWLAYACGEKPTAAHPSLRRW